MNEWDKIRLLRLAKGALVCVAAVGLSYLLYDSFWPLLLLPIALFVFYRIDVKSSYEKEKASLLGDFIGVLETVSEALLAGFSMENAWKEAMREYQGHRYMGEQLGIICKSLEMNRPIEILITEFAEATEVEEIMNFAEVFSFAKRTGGNVNEILERTLRQMKEKKEVLDEIEVTVAAKKMEQRVMNFMPIFMLLYLRLTSGNYMDPLYHNAFGVCLMTICLGIYVGAYALSKRILRFNL